jgi:hypothetical protein
VKLPGIHIYVIAPLAESESEEPSQIEDIIAVATTVGVGFTVTAIESVGPLSEQVVFTPITYTQYVPATEPVMLIAEVLCPLFSVSPLGTVQV